jgi:hypothetical protein
MQADYRKLAATCILSCEPARSVRQDPDLHRKIRFCRRRCSKTDVAVSLRLLRAIGDIAASTPAPEFRRILVERGLRIVAGCAEKLGEEELRALLARQAAMESFTAI